MSIDLFSSLKKNKTEPFWGKEFNSKTNRTKVIAKIYLKYGRK